MLVRICATGKVEDMPPREAAASLSAGTVEVVENLPARETAALDRGTRITTTITRSTLRVRS